jgi:DNA transposition AAA+ family ATPase
MSEEHTLTLASTGIRLAGDKVNEATKDLPDQQRSAIRWLHAHGLEQNLGLKQLGEAIGYSHTVLSLLFNNRYEGRIQAVTTAIDRYRKAFESQERVKGAPFIETALTRRIFSVCDRAREYQKICAIFGDAQIGKTEALKEYTRQNNHGATLYLRTPTGGALSDFMAMLGHELRIPASIRRSERRSRILRGLDGRMLLIVDEMDLCMAIGVHMAARLLEYLRELHDVTKCGLLLCGNNVFRQALEDGEFGEVTQKIRRRMLLRIPLPAAPRAEELDLFAEAFQLPPAEGDAKRLQGEIIERHGLGMWLTTLRMGREVAARKKQELGWEHVLLADRGRAHLEAGR